MPFAVSNDYFENRQRLHTASEWYKLRFLPCPYRKPSARPASTITVSYDKASIVEHRDAVL